MKKMTTLILFLILTLQSYCPLCIEVLYVVAPVKIQPYELIWNATCMLESNKNPLAYNKKEKAVGLSQIRQVRLNDYNRQTGKNYKLSDMFDPAKNKEVFMFYAAKHNYTEIEIISRCWNGGEENGMKLKQTYKYYLKVKKFLL